MKDSKGHGSNPHGLSDQTVAATLGQGHPKSAPMGANAAGPADPAKVRSFITGAQGILNDYYARNFSDAPHMKPPTLEITNPDAARYLRIAAVDRAPDGKINSRSAHTFIDKTTGDVLKPAGWKTPAKGVRGNIHDPNNGLGRMGPHGPAYNK